MCSKIKFLTLTPLTSGRVLIIGVGQEVAGDQSSDPVYLRHVESIVVHVPVHVDDLPSLETQLSLKGGKRTVVYH